MNELLLLNPDGSFRTTAQTTLGPTSAWGRWAQQGSTLTLWTTGYNPPDLKLPAQAEVPFKVPKPDTLEVGVNVCRRVK